VIPFGAGSSLEGHVLATRGGVSVDTQLLDGIRRASVEDLDVTVQAGVRARQAPRARRRGRARNRRDAEPHKRALDPAGLFNPDKVLATE
jgi:FAD/FMN-containing dehydrogenase